MRAHQRTKRRPGKQYIQTMRMMKTDMMKSYLKPEVSLTRIEIESGFMAASKDPVEEKNVNVTIEKQDSDVPFTIESWD